MSGTKAVLDSNAIIFATKGKIDVDEMLSRYDEFYASIITFIEVYAFEFQDQTEKDITDEIFANLQIIELNQAIANQSIAYRKNKIKKIKLPDAVIPATAKYINGDLLSDDWDDFQNIDSTIIIKDLDDLKI